MSCPITAAAGQTYGVQIVARDASTGVAATSQVTQFTAPLPGPPTAVTGPAALGGQSLCANGAPTYYLQGAATASADVGAQAVVSVQVSLDPGMATIGQTITGPTVTGTAPTPVSIMGCFAPGTLYYNGIVANSTASSSLTAVGAVASFTAQAAPDPGP